MSSRSLLILPAVLMCAACGGRSDQSATASPAPASGSYSPATGTSGSGAAATGAVATGPTFTATVITIDAAAGSVTLREFVAGAPAGGTGDVRAGDRTMIMEGEAKANLAVVKTGEQVMVTCRPMSGATTAGGLGACEAVLTLAPAPR